MLSRTALSPQRQSKTVEHYREKAIDCRTEKPELCSVHFVPFNNRWSAGPAKAGYKGSPESPVMTG